MPLIDVTKHIRSLDTQRIQLATSSLSVLLDYSAYCVAVGQYQGLTNAIENLRKELDDEDDDQS